MLYWILCRNDRSLLRRRGLCCLCGSRGVDAGSYVAEAYGYDLTEPSTSGLRQPWLARVAQRLFG